MRHSSSSAGSSDSTVHRSAGARRRPRGAAGAGLAAGGLLALALTAAAPAAAQPMPDLALAVVAEGLPQVTGITHAGDERLFVTLQEGRVMVVDGAVRPQPFLDIRGQVTFEGEQGLLSLAFHPDYATNGWFFVDYVDSAGDTVVSRFQVSDDPNRAEPSSEAVLLRIAQPFANHNGGQIAFGPDGKLYVATGDGGGSFDPQCNAQNLSSLLGKILRLDVDAGADAPPYHTVPPDNPFVGQGPARGEIWAYGLRNPWRFSFDRATGDLFIGDVGQYATEEIDFLAAGAPGGANYGWKVMEGTTCTFRRLNCTMPLPPCSSPPLVHPILTYPNGGGECAVTGGYVYRGSAIDGLAGRYLFGDYCSGRLWLAHRFGSAWRSRDLPLSAPVLQTFGEGVDGEIYLGARGRLLKLIAAGAEPDPGPDPEPEPEPVCSADGDTLCLGPDGRFAVEVRFRVGDAPPAPAGTRPITGDTGAFWFFDPENLELLVKVLDACGPFGRFWVFAAGLTDVETELTVTDMVAGGTRSYLNAAGTAFQPVQDTDAFATCP